MNDTPEIRETFAAFDIDAVTTTYSLAGIRPVSEVEPDMVALWSDVEGILSAPA